MVSIVVLNWNGWRDTLGCLASLEKLDYPSHELVVVDNGSTDGSEDRIREAYPNVGLLQTGINLGFAGGVNFGMEHAFGRGADYVWLLNNDTIVDAGALSAMVDVAESDEKIGLVGSSLHYLHEPESLQAYGGGIIDWWSGTNGFLKQPAEAGLDFLTGASLLVKRPVFESIGPLDESYFFYWEDVAYSRRAVEAGWALAVAGTSRVLHKEGGTVSSGARSASLASDKHMIGSRIQFFGEYGGSRWPVAVLVTVAGMMVNRLRRGQADRIPPLAMVAARACRSVFTSKARYHWSSLSGRLSGWWSRK